MLFCAHITSKYIWGIFICNGPVACRNGILSRIIGQPRAWVIGSESWKRSIARKVSDGVGVDGVGANFPFLRVFAVSPYRRLRDNRQQLPGNVQKTLKPFETSKNKEKQRKMKKSRKMKKAKNKTKMRKKERKNTSKMRTRQRNANKKEIHSNPIYTNTIKNFPNRGDDLVRFR